MPEKQNIFYEIPETTRTFLFSFICIAMTIVGIIKVLGLDQLKDAYIKSYESEIEITTKFEETKIELERQKIELEQKSLNELEIILSKQQEALTAIVEFIGAQKTANNQTAQAIKDNQQAILILTGRINQLSQDSPDKKIPRRKPLVIFEDEAEE